MRTLSCGEYSSAPKTKSCDRSPELLQLVSPQSFLQSTQSPSSNPYPVLTVHISDEFLQFTSAKDFSGGAVVKNPPAMQETQGLTPGLGRFPWRKNGNPLQYSCLRNPMDKGAWWATVHGVAKSQIRPSNRAHDYYIRSCHSHI